MTATREMCKKILECPDTVNIWRLLLWVQEQSTYKDQEIRDACRERILRV